MNIYEIDQQIAQLIADSIDPETGELILDNETLDALQMEREAKVENLALWIKNSNAMAQSIRAEEKALAERRQAIERKTERLKDYLAYALGGQKFTTPRVSCTFRKTEAVELEPEFMDWARIAAPGLLRYKEPEADKTEIKKALKEGATLAYAALVTRQSMSIK